MEKKRIFLRTNYQIKAREVRLIDLDGTQLGIVQVPEALRKANERRMDLVEIVPNASPPVCKIMEYAKYKYEQEKKLKDARKKHKGGQLKEIRLRPHIGEHDLMVKLKHAREFIGENNKVRFTIMFMGREMAHTDLGYALLEKIKNNMADIAATPDSPVMLGKRLIFTMEPQKK